MKHRSDVAPRAPLALPRALGAILALSLLWVVGLLAAPAQARPSRAPRLERQGAPADDWFVERASLETLAIGVERAVDGGRTRRPDSAGPYLQQNALGVELPGACALVRTRTRVRQPCRLVRPCVSARAPPLR